MVALLKLGSLLDFVRIVRLLHSGKFHGTEVGTAAAKFLSLDQKLRIKTAPSYCLFLNTLCLINLPLLALHDPLFSKEAVSTNFFLLEYTIRS